MNTNHNNFTNKYFLDNDFPIKSDIVSQKTTKKHSDYSTIKKSNKNNKKNKPKIKKTILLILLYIFFITIFTFCILKIIDWNKDNKKTEKNIKDAEKITDVTEVTDNKDTELINEPTNQESDYWYYIKFPLIEVDFNELKKKNTDTVAWIQVNNTNINYPVVHTDNNDFYLNHSYDKSVNDAGWVFMDFRNNSNLSNKNTILYAHSRLDKTMFGSLSKVLKSSWYQNKDNHIIKISTPTENSLWQIFSVYKIEDETYYITTKFDNNSSYMEFLTTLKNRSKYNFKTELNETDVILTLSTCYSETERTVVHAKKIKKNTRDS